jgi:hypothetical protein
MRAHRGCLQYAARLTTLPSAQWSHAVSDYSNANAHAAPPLNAVRTRARAIAWRGSYTAYLCANETDVANQRMSTRRSQCEGDLMHPVWERTCADSSAAFLLATDVLACQTSPSCKTADFGGPKGQKVPSRLCARRTRTRIWSVRWSRSAGARCETRRRRALACVRAAGGVYNNRHVQPAASGDAPRECAARDGKNGGAWGFAARQGGHGDCRRVHYACGFVSHASCTLPPGAPSRLDARCICLAAAVGCIGLGSCRLMAEAGAHLVGVGRC